MGVTVVVMAVIMGMIMGMGGGLPGLQVLTWVSLEFGFAAGRTEEKVLALVLQPIPLGLCGCRIDAHPADRILCLCDRCWRVLGVFERRGFELLLAAGAAEVIVAALKVEPIAFRLRGFRVWRHPADEIECLIFHSGRTTPQVP